MKRDKRKNRNKNDDKEKFVVVWLIKTGRLMKVKKRTAIKLIKQGKASLEPPQQTVAQQNIPKSFRFVQMIETGEIRKVTDAEAARLVENEEAGYVL